MSRTVPLSEVAPLAEGELLKLGRYGNALVLKVQRVLAQAGCDFPGAACLRQVLDTATAMSDAFDDYLAKRNYSSDALRAPEAESSAAASSQEALDGAIEAAAPAFGGEVQLAMRSTRAREFYGHSDVVPLGEVLDFVGFTRKTGTLRIFAPQETLVVEFEEGDVTGACSDRPPVGSRVGELLVARGSIRAEVLEQFVASSGERRGRLGEALVQAGLVPAEELVEALAEQVQEIFNRLVAMENVEFFFRARPGDEAEVRSSMRLNPTQLLLEGARCRDASVVASR